MRMAGRSAIIQQAHRTALVHQVLHHQVVSANLRRQQVAASIQLRLRLADRPVGALLASVLAIIGVSTDQTTVMISAERHAHILTRRREVSAEEAEFAITKLSEALANLRFWRTGGKNRSVFELVGYSPSAGRYLLIALKFVGSEDNADAAWWIQTAHPLGQTMMGKYQRQGRLQPLVEPAV